MTKKLSPLFSWRGAVFSKGSGLSPTQRLVAAALSLHMSEKGDSCFPGRALLSEETGLSIRAVEKAIAALEDAGFLSVKRGGALRGGKRMSSRYTATTPTGERGSLVASDDRRTSEHRPANVVRLTGERGSPEDVKEVVKEDVRVSRTPQPPNPKLREILTMLADKKAIPG